MRPKGTKLQLEVRRRVAVSLLEAGWGIRQVARHVNTSPTSVCRWRDMVAQHGDRGLDAKRQRGGQGRLTPEQCQHLLNLLSQGARAHGFRNELWTLARVASVVERHFGITYCPSGIWHVLRRLGWRPQKPAKRARERDEDAISAWLNKQWPKLKKSPTSETHDRLHR